MKSTQGRKTMRKTIAAVILIVLCSVAFANAQAFWYTNGVQTNPGAGQVMADTGPISIAGGQATYQIRIVTSGTIMATFDFEHRNDANTTTLKSQQIRLLASGTQEVGILVIEVAEGERFRVVMVNGIVGTVQASIFRQ